MIGRDESKKRAQEVTAEIEAATSVAAEAASLASAETAQEQISMRNPVLGREAISSMQGRVPSDQNLATQWAERQVKYDAETESIKTPGADRELGRQAIFGPEQPSFEQANANLVKEMAEQDNGYGNEYESGVSTVGEESRREQREHRAEDDENLRNEIDPKRDSEAKIMARSQEERGRLVASGAGRFLSRKNYLPSEMLSWYQEQRNAMLLDFENPRRLGDRN